MNNNNYLFFFSKWNTSLSKKTILPSSSSHGRLLENRPLRVKSLCHNQNRNPNSQQNQTWHRQSDATTKSSVSSETAQPTRSGRLTGGLPFSATQTNLSSLVYPKRKPLLSSKSFNMPTRSFQTQRSELGTILIVPRFSSPILTQLVTRSSPTYSHSSPILFILGILILARGFIRFILMFLIKFMPMRLILLRN